MKWQVKISLLEDGTVEFSPSEGDLSPVDLLLRAVASCFAKSCHMVQSARGEAYSKVIVDVAGTKAEDRPNRIGVVQIQWSLPSVDQKMAAQIVKDAKRICTITNTMSCEFEVVEL